MSCFLLVLPLTNYECRKVLFFLSVHFNCTDFGSSVEGIALGLTMSSFATNKKNQAQSSEVLLKVNYNIKHLHRLHYYLRVLIFHPAPLLSLSLSLFLHLTLPFSFTIFFLWCVYFKARVQRRERQCLSFK